MVVPIYKWSKFPFAKLEKADKKEAEKFFDSLNLALFEGVRYPDSMDSFTPEVEKEMKKISPVWFEFSLESGNYLIPVRATGLGAFRIIALQYKSDKWLVTDSVDCEVEKKFNEAEYLGVGEASKWFDGEIRRMLEVFGKHFLVFKWEPEDLSDEWYFYIPLVSFSKGSSE